ncbi:hypothetical protein K7432_013324 [Basidiobolus ranarum]|uniref:BZIP domain-containing protein n=1 Tax=Basidiobolus ranarum TaxID=34480 RepID=A0ABR2WJE0_9FUNG
MAQFDTFDFVTPNSLNLQHSSETDGKEIKEELDLWSTAQFTYDSTIPFDLNHNLVSSVFDTFSLNLCTPPMSTPALSQSAVSPVINLFDDGSEFTSLMAPHPAFPLTTGTPDLIESTQNTTAQNNSSLLKTQPVPQNKRKKSMKDRDIDGEGSPEQSTAEEDKRRRNTAASARFRIKKKIREQILEKTVEEMTTKAETMESRVKELEKEVEWLRALLLEKNTKLSEESTQKQHAKESLGIF